MRGELMLSFSRGMVNAYSSVTKLPAERGKDELVLRGRIVPRRTGSLSFPKLLVNLSEFPKRNRCVALASDSETVEVR